MQLSIIIPAYNEAGRIVRTLQNTLDYLNRQDSSSEIIVVSDGSHDRTGSVVQHNFATQGTAVLRMLEYHPNRGKCDTGRDGTRESRSSPALFLVA